MNSKRGLGGFMSALLAATSMIGGASAATKEGYERVWTNGRRVSSVPPFLKNPMAYYLGVPVLVATTGIGYGLYRHLSKGKKREVEKIEVENREVEKIEVESAEELSGDVYEIGSNDEKILRKWGFYGGVVKVFLSCYTCRILKKEGFGRLLGVTKYFKLNDTMFEFEFYVNIKDEKDITETFGSAISSLVGICEIFVSGRVFAGGGRAAEFLMDQCHDCQDDENEKKFTNIVNGENLLDSSGYLGYLCDKFTNDRSKEIAKDVFGMEYKSRCWEFEECSKILLKERKEIYVNEKDGKLYVREMKGK